MQINKSEDIHGNIILKRQYHHLNIQNNKTYESLILNKKLIFYIIT
jgi:hypothetical protein